MNIAHSAVRQELKNGTYTIVMEALEMLGRGY